MPKPRRVIRLDVLAHADRAALARLLAPFGAFLESAGAPMDVIVSSRAGDRSIARRLSAALHDARAPDALVALCEAFDALAHERAAAHLVRLDDARKLPRGTHGAANLALAALLDAPELARKVLVTARVLAAAHDPRRAYSDCVPKRAIPYAPAHHEPLVRAHAKRFEKRDASRYCDVYVTETEEMWIFEITHGDRPRTREIIDTASLALALVTDTAARRAYAVLDKSTGWLSVAAHAPGVKDLVRQAFGEALAEDEEHFAMGELYDLSPFARPAAALADHRVPGLERVELLGITVVSPAGTTWSGDITKGDLLGAADGTPAHASATIAQGKLVGVRLRVKLEDRAEPSTATLTAKGGRNVLEIHREDHELATVLRAWFVACGVLRASREGEADVGREAPAASLQPEP